MDTTVQLIEGVEGHSIYLGDIRIAGPKPWGGGHVAKTWKTDVSGVLYALNCLYYPKHQPLGSVMEEAETLVRRIFERENEG